MSEIILNREWEELNLRPEREATEQQIFWDELGHAPAQPPSVEEQLLDVRKQLAEIRSAVREDLPQIVLKGAPAQSDTPTGIIVEKEVQRKQRELKEKAPRRYDEKLLYLADTQLKSLTHAHSLGAILQYLEHEAPTFTHTVLGGDIFDFTQQAHFSKDNALGNRVTQEEIAAGKWFMNWINERFAHTKRVFTLGNHEKRWDALHIDSTNGLKEWLIPLEEMFDLQDWEIYRYGEGESYDWHGRKLWHGEKGGMKQNTPKLEVERSFRSVTFGHSPFNRAWEAIDADGNILDGRQHAGVSDHPEYSKNGYKQVSDGFGIYYWSRYKGTNVENAYSVSIPINNPRFISPEGDLYDGKGFNLDRAIADYQKQQR